MIKINIRNKTYRIKKQKLVALEDINFETSNNGLICILGPSGSGKTTLMNIIGALDSDFEGDVVINNKSLKQAKKKDLDSYRKNTIGFIFQQFNLLNKFTVYDNVALALTLSNVENKKNRINRLLKSVEMEEYAKRRVNVLSGGQKQRVAIARALANDPDIILADEPTGALDSRIGHEIMEMLKELSKEKLVIVITHSEEIASEFADTIIRLEDGKIVETIQKHEINTKVKDIKIETKSVMSYLKAFTHSLKNLYMKKGRTFATAVGMSIGIIGIALAFALSNGSSKLVKDQIDSILPANNLMVSLKDDETSDPMSLHYGEKGFDIFSYQDILDIKALNDKIVTYWPVPSKAMEEFFSEMSLSEENAKSGKLEERSLMSMYGPEPYETLKDNLTLGRPPENKNEIVISMTTAEALLDSEQNINELIDKNLYIKFGSYVGTYSDEDGQNKILTFKIVGITSINTMGYSIYQKVEDTLSLYESMLSIPKKDLGFMELYIYLDNDLRNDEIKTIINKLNDNQDKFAFAGAAEKTMNDVQTFMDTVRNVLIGFSSISVVVAILMIGIVVYISVIERISEIGIIRAIGGRRKDIRNIFLFESMIIGVFAGALGVLISTGICYGINQIVAYMIRSYGMQLGNVNVAVLNPVVGVSLIATCILLALIAGLIPSQMASRMDPIVALRRK